MGVGLNGTRAVGVFVYEGEIGRGRKGCDSIQVKKEGRGMKHLLGKALQSGFTYGKDGDCR